MSLLKTKQALGYVQVLVEMKTAVVNDLCYLEKEEKTWTNCLTSKHKHLSFNLEQNF